MKHIKFDERLRSVLLVAVCVVILVIVAAYPSLFSLRVQFPAGLVHSGAASALIGSIVGGVMGAVAATVGISITDRQREKRTRDHKRRVMHYNSVVKLQREMNVIRGSLEDNTQALKSIIEANEHGLPTLQRPIQIATNESHFFDLYDIRLINMLNDLFYLIRRINLDSTNLSRALDVLADQLFADKINNDQYKSEVQVFNGQVVQMRSHILYTLDHLVLDIIAYVRLCADRDASDEMKNRFNEMLKNRIPITDDEISNMREAIKQELEQQEAEGLVQQQEESSYR